MGAVFIGQVEMGAIPRKSRIRARAVDPEVLQPVMMNAVLVLSAAFPLFLDGPPGPVG